MLWGRHCHAQTIRTDFAIVNIIAQRLIYVKYIIMMYFMNTGNLFLTFV